MLPDIVRYAFLFVMIFAGLLWVKQGMKKPMPEPNENGEVVLRMHIFFTLVGILGAVAGLTMVTAALLYDIEGRLETLIAGAIFVLFSLPYIWLYARRKLVLKGNTLELKRGKKTIRQMDTTQAKGMEFKMLTGVVSIALNDGNHFKLPIQFVAVAGILQKVTQDSRIDVDSI